MCPRRLDHSTKLQTSNFLVNEAQATSRIFKIIAEALQRATKLGRGELPVEFYPNIPFHGIYLS